MRWSRLLRYDFLNGIARNWSFGLVPLGTLLLCHQCRQLLLVYDLTGTWAAYLMYCFKGMAFITRQTMSGGFQVPLLWMMILFLPLFISLNYPYQDMKTVGQQIILRSGSRVRWWIVKCIWNITCTTICFLLVYLTSILYCLGCNIPITLHVPAQPVLAIFSQAEVTDAVERLTAGQVAFAAVLLPFLAAAALDMLEMLLSLLIRPAYSFLVCVAFVTASAYASTPVLIGNYANLTRCGLFINNGLDSRLGLSLCLGALLGAVIVGAVFFRRQNILPDYKEL